MLRWFFLRLWSWILFLYTSLRNVLIFSKCYWRIFINLIVIYNDLFILVNIFIYNLWWIFKDLSLIFFFLYWFFLIITAWLFKNAWSLALLKKRWQILSILNQFIILRFHKIRLLDWLHLIVEWTLEVVSWAWKRGVKWLFHAIILIFIKNINIWYLVTISFVQLISYLCSYFLIAFLVLSVCSSITQPLIFIILILDNVI